MNEPTIESATVQPPDAGDPDGTVDAGAVKAGTLSKRTDVLNRRLHFATLWLPCVELFIHVIIPVLITSIFVPLGTVIVFVVCFGLLPTAVLHVVRYVTYRYLLTADEIVINSGVIFRRERRIPLDRIQEVEVHQGVVHRILDLARVEITTAGSDVKEASLNVLSRQAAEAVKESIGRCQIAAKGDRQVGVADVEPDFVCQLGMRDLLRGGLTSRLVASLGAVIAAIVYFEVFVGIGEAWWGKAEQDLNGRIGRRWPGDAGINKLLEHFESLLPDLGPFNFVFDLFFDETLPKSVSLVLLGLAGSVAAYVIRYHGFRFARSGDLLTTSYGLLALRNGSLSRDRIQALKLEEGLLRRYFGLASIRVDSAGDRTEISEVKNRDVLVPVASTATAQTIAKQAMPGLTTLEPNWQRVSPQAVLRGSRKGWLLILAIMLQTFAIVGWYCLVFLPAIPLVYFLNYQWFRHTGFWLEEHYFLSRKGWLNRETVCLPVKSIQNVAVTQNVFDRRRNLATLSIDTAGQSNTGGGPIIRHLPVQEANGIQWSLVNCEISCEAAKPRRIE